MLLRKFAKNLCNNPLGRGDTRDFYCPIYEGGKHAIFPSLILKRKVGSTRWLPAIFDHN
jgi:hypothetical protein